MVVGTLEPHTGWMLGWKGKRVQTGTPGSPSVDGMTPASAVEENSEPHVVVCMDGRLHVWLFRVYGVAFWRGWSEVCLLTVTWRWGHCGCMSCEYAFSFCVCFSDMCVVLSLVGFRRFRDSRHLSIVLILSNPRACHLSSPSS